jgi:hypothetical protein
VSECIAQIIGTALMIFEIPKGYIDFAMSPRRNMPNQRAHAPFCSPPPPKSDNNFGKVPFGG